MDLVPSVMIAPNRKDPPEDLGKATPLPKILFDFPELLVLPDEFNKCIVGLSWDCGRVVYDIDRMIDVITATSDGELDKDDAWEHFTFNIECAFPPDQGPYFIHTELPEIVLPSTKEDHANKEEEESNNTGQPAGTD